MNASPPAVRESASARGARLARRLQLLELEAGVQRAALVATLEHWSRHPGVAAGSVLGSLGARLLRVPRLRWLLLATFLGRAEKQRAGRGPSLH